MLGSAKSLLLTVASAPAPPSIRAFQAGGRAFTQASSATGTVAVPSNVATGDLLVVFVAFTGPPAAFKSNALSVMAPTGGSAGDWNRLVLSQHTSFDGDTGVATVLGAFCRRAAAEDQGASLSVRCTAQAKAAINTFSYAVVSLSNCAGADNAAFSAGDSTINWASVAPTLGNDLLLLYGLQSGDQSTTSTEYPNTAPVGSPAVTLVYLDTSTQTNQGFGLHKLVLPSTEATTAYQMAVANSPSNGTTGNTLTTTFTGI